MTAPKQPCPTYRWCTGEHVNGYTLPLHRSKQKEIGPQHPEGNGQVVLWIHSGANGPIKLTVQAVHSYSITADLSLDDADLVVNTMVALIAEARRSQPR